MREVAQRLELDAGDVKAVSNLIVPFYLSHRWLRVRGAPSSHHPDSVHNIKARQLVKFAKWFKRFASERGFDCGVAFWTDFCCSEQDNPTDAELAVMALLAYIAACIDVVTWQTPDFDSRCWLMV